MTSIVASGDLAIRGLGDRLAGDVYLPGDPGYSHLVTPWNLAEVGTRPVRAVAAVASADDVAEVMRFAGASGMRVAVQRTGHGAVPFDGTDDVVLVHTGRLADVTVNVASRTARVGGGAIWQDVFDAATPHGLAPLSGSAPTVGVAGYLTGGGVGPLARTYGLSADYVRAFELVTGEGAILQVTPDSEPELFWGLRGAKATLGIVTALEIDLPELAVFYGGSLFFDAADAGPVLHAWREACDGLAEHTTTSASLLQFPDLPGVPPELAGRMTVGIRIASVAGLAEAGAFAAPMLAVAAPVLGGLREVPYAELGTLHDDPADPMPFHERCVLLDELTPEFIDALIGVAGPGAGSPQAVVQVRHFGGALARPGRRGPSSFCYRDAAAALIVVGLVIPPVGDAVPAHAQGMIDALAPFTTGTAMPNFGPSGDPETNAAICYDQDTLARLEALARRHDPAGVLRVGQVTFAADSAAGLR